MDQDNSDRAKPKDTKGKRVDLGGVPSSSTQHDANLDASKSGPGMASFISRLGASTTQLTNAMIQRHPSPTCVTESLPPSKGESSKSTRSVSASETSTCRNQPAQAFSNGTFASTSTQEQCIMGESDFSAFLDGTNKLEIIEPGHIEKHGFGQSYDPGSEQTTPPGMANLATDGMDVVDLLDSRYDEVEETAMFLSDTEQVALRCQLFDDGEAREHLSQRGQWEDALNFFPDFGPSGNSIQAYADLLGTSDLQEATNIWTSQWRHVLTSYTDTVWGDLSPLVSVARDELASLSDLEGNEASPSKLKALRRLQQILTHVRGV